MIHIYKIRQWRFNIKKKTSKLKSSRVYYSAEYEEKKCFIKIVKNSRVIENEIFINEYMSRCGIQFVPKIFMGDIDFTEDSSVLVTESIPDISGFKLPDDEQIFSQICEEFEHIHSYFHKYDIIHGDMSVFNVFLNHENRLLIIDFGIAWAPGSEIFRINAPRIGTYFMLSETHCIYDNAYSFLKILDDCGISLEFKQKECYKRIEKLVGKHTHKTAL